MHFESAVRRLLDVPVQLRSPGRENTTPL